MRNRTAFIGALMSLIPVGQTCLIGTGSAITTAAVILTVPHTAQAQSAQFYFDRGLESYRNEDFLGAIFDYSKAIEINPRYAEAYNNRGDAKFRLKDDSGAISDYSKAIEINPRYAKAYSNRGDVKFLYEGDYQGCCADWRKASKLGDNYASQSVNRFCNKMLPNSNPLYSRILRVLLNILKAIVRFL